MRRKCIWRRSITCAGNWVLAVLSDCHAFGFMLKAPSLAASNIPCSRHPAKLKRKSGMPPSIWFTYLKCCPGKPVTKAASPSWCSISLSLSRDTVLFKSNPKMDNERCSHHLLTTLQIITNSPLMHISRGQIDTSDLKIDCRNLITNGPQDWSKPTSIGLAHLKPKKY